MSDVYGVGNAARLGVLQPSAIAAGFTIIYGSLRVLSQAELNKRLAYSTVSQVSYIILGTAQAHKVDLLMMGARGRDALAAPLLAAQRHRLCASPPIQL